MSYNLINKKRKREPTECIFYPYSKNKHLKEDLTENVYNLPNSSKRKKLSEKNSENAKIISIDSSSPPISNYSSKHYPYTINEIINKKYSVFKCENIITEELCAIKIINMKDSKTKFESAEIEAKLAKYVLQKDRRNKSHCIKIFDNFKFTKNKIPYYAIVTELLDLNLYEFLKNNSHQGYTMSQIQYIAKQIFEGIAFLHKINIIHTDLKPENILLEDASYNKITKYEEVPLNISLRHDNNVNSRNASAISTNVSVSSNINKILYKKLKKCDVKIIDFGSAIELKDRGNWLICTRQYRPPEVILECCKWDQKSDIWSIGCILVELYTGELLFPTYNNQEQLCFIEKTCGHYPNWMVKNTKKKEFKKIFVDCLKHRNDKVLDIKRCDNYDDIKESLANLRKIEESICPKHEEFCKFILYLMNIDPKKRPSANEALKHEFFKIKFED